MVIVVMVKLSRVPNPSVCNGHMSASMFNTFWLKPIMGPNRAAKKTAESFCLIPEYGYHSAKVQFGTGMSGLFYFNASTITLILSSYH